VNQSPSFHTDSALDKEVKESLIGDTLTLLNILQCDKRKILEEDKQRAKNRLLRTIQK
jgi:tubulin polyglutamylase TTLL6/13